MQDSKYLFTELLVQTILSQKKLGIETQPKTSEVKEVNLLLKNKEQMVKEMNKDLSRKSLSKSNNLD